MSAHLRLFEGYGLELEYMIVSTDGLDVRPLADELLRAVGGSDGMDVEFGPVAWSNELALHVIEMKCNGPAGSLAGLGALFQDHVKRMQALLEPLGARLLPTGMHPWMNPETELKLWPHENNIIYSTFDRIFDCRGHGWANLQSTHVNLPFADDDELGRLHAAIRLVLPLIPALAASTPLADGAPTGFMDTRLEMYRNNARRVPSVMGRVIPERVWTRREYEEGLLAGIYRDLEPHDPERVLRNEWVNARGCIARFDRMALEIRLIDLQECPAADLAVATAVVAAVRGLVEERSLDTRRQQGFHERELEGLLLETIRLGDRAVLDHPHYMEALGFPERGRARALDVWQHLAESLLPQVPGQEEYRPHLDVILGRGCLARRILEAAGEAAGAAELRPVYRRLADCLEQGVSFTPGP